MSVIVQVLHDIPVRIFFPTLEQCFNAPILLFFHGGGWVTGNIDSYDKVCGNLARATKHIVVSVDYRLAPEYPFPAALNDCYAVAKEIFHHSSILQVSPKDITLIGDSAGGNLAAALSLMARDRGEFMPARQILLYPSTYNDHSEKSPFSSVRKNGTGFLLTSKRVSDYMELYLGGQDNRNNPYFAPLLAKNLADQPNTLIITADYDPLRDEGEAYGRALKKAGNNVQVHRMTDALHGFFALPPTFSPVKKSYRLINSFLKKPF